VIGQISRRENIVEQESFGASSSSSGKMVDYNKEYKPLFRSFYSFNAQRKPTEDIQSFL
jgi:hypothetical protein